MSVPRIEAAQVPRRFAHRLPDAQGWWARRDDSDRVTVKWFKVVTVLNGDGRIWYWIWHSDTQRYLQVADYSNALTCWAGPVVLEDDDD